MNKQISQLPQYFPNSISPFDMAVAEARKQVSDMGYDPYRIKDYSQSGGIFTVTSTHTWLTGLASFYRMGNITLTMENGTVNSFFYRYYSFLSYFKIELSQQCKTFNKNRTKIDKNSSSQLSYNNNSSKL